MKIEKAIKESLKQQRLDQYQKTYFTLRLDLVALQSNINADESVKRDIENTMKRMDSIRLAYEAVEAIPVDEETI